MLRLENIKIYEDLTEKEILEKACLKYKLDFNKVIKYNILKNLLMQEIKITYFIIIQLI